MRYVSLVCLYFCRNIHNVFQVSPVFLLQKRGWLATHSNPLNQPLGKRIKQTDGVALYLRFPSSEVFLSIQSQTNEWKLGRTKILLKHELKAFFTDSFPRTTLPVFIISRYSFYWFFFIFGI